VFKKIKKRDGPIVGFDSSQLSAAIASAGKATGEFGDEEAENPLIFVTGPFCGVPGFAGSRWQVLGKSPINNRC